jgi:toxin-antitoxin system PIN domain toxin
VTASGSGAKAPKVRETRAGYAVAPVVGRRPARALLDVNVLIALLDADHIHHRRASQWLAEHIAAGWASCAITQNGCVRIMSQPGYPNPLPTAQVAARLAEAASTRHHLFVPSNASLLDAELFDTAQLLGHRQVTDAWLLGLAVAHGLRLVSFDAGLPLRAVRGATASHIVAI